MENQQKMPDERYHVNVPVRFYSMMLLSNYVGPFHTLLLKDQNSLIEQSQSALKLKYSNRAAKKCLQFLNRGL